MTQNIKILKSLDWDVLKKWGFTQKGELDRYRSCDLPTGWELRANKYEYLIVDDLGRRRIWGRRIDTVVLIHPRYEVQPDYNDEFCLQYYVADRWERKTLYSTEYTDCCLDDLPFTTVQEIEANLIRQALDWIDTNLNEECRVVLSNALSRSKSTQKSSPK